MWVANGTRATWNCIYGKTPMKPAEGYEPFTPSASPALRAILRPADVLLVEGNNHISGVIKYLTQSSWSHSALYVGPMADAATPEGKPPRPDRGENRRRRRVG